MMLFCDLARKTMSRFMAGCILMDVISEKYPDFLNMELSPSWVDPLFLCPSWRIY
jgi:hypothetical protein